MTSLPGTSGHLRSRDVISCHVTASTFELQPCKKWYSQSTWFFGLQTLPGDSGQRCHFWVTSGHLRSRDVISSHVTDSPCKLQPCRKWNSQYMCLFGLLQLLPGDFRSNDVTFRWLPVAWGHVTSFSVTWPPLHASYKLVRSETHYTPVFGLQQPVRGDFQSHDVPSGSLPVTSHHVMSFPVTWLPPPASYSLVGSETQSIREFLTFYNHFQVTSSQMTPLPGHFRSPHVTSCHFLSRDCLPLRPTAL